MQVVGDVGQHTRARAAPGTVVVRRRGTRRPGSLMRAGGNATHSCKNSGRREAGTVVVRRRSSRLQQKTTAAIVDDDAVDNRRLLVVSPGSVSIAKPSIASSSCRAGSSSVQASSNNEHIQFTKSNKQQEAVK
uniref:Uncharacterized protein n=1 Tax=Oryza meridionalis TaxID=40149 RepID=A0A0E0FBP2_9ORYZ